MMSVHIGLMIWKEMKRQNFPISEFANQLEITKTKAQEILNTSNIDVVTLVSISEILHYNFLNYYEKSPTFSKIESEDRERSVEEIKRLKSLLIEKNKVIEAKDQFIKIQADTISLLEKEQYR